MESCFNKAVAKLSEENKQLLTSVHNKLKRNKRNKENILKAIQDEAYSSLKKRANLVAKGKTIAPLDISILNQLNESSVKLKDNLNNAIANQENEAKDTGGFIIKMGKVFKDLFRLERVSNTNKYTENGDKNPNFNKATPIMDRHDFYIDFLNNPSIADKYLNGTPEEIAQQKKELERLAIFAVKFRTALANHITKEMDMGKLVGSRVYQLLNGTYSSDIRINNSKGSKTVKGFKDISIDPRIANTLSTVAYNYMAGQSLDTLFNDNEAINKILQRDVDHDVSSEEKRILREIGNSALSLEEGWGAQTMKMLGIREIKDENNITDPKETARLELGIGLLISNTLRTNNGFDNAPLLIQKEVPVSKLQEFNPEVDLKTADAGSKSVRFLQANSVRNKETLLLDPTPNIQEMKDKFSDPDLPLDAIQTKTVLQNVLGIPNEDTMPSTKPVEVKDSIRGSFMKMSEEVQENIQTQNNQRYSMNTDVMDLLVNLYGNEDITDNNKQMREFLLALTKYQEDTSNMINEDKISTEGKNRGYIRSVDNLIKMYRIWNNKWKAKPFYFNFFVPTNNRSMLESNVFQPQNDKFHRFFLMKESWETELNLKAKKGSNAAKRVLIFKAAVNQALGAGFDKSLKNRIAPTFDEILTKFKEYALAADRLINGESTDIQADRNLVIEGVKKGEEGSHSLVGLINLAKYIKAVENDEAKVRVNLPIETDAATSGVIIGLHQLPVGNINTIISKLEAGGNFTDVIYSDMGDYLNKQGNLDNYQQVGTGIAEVRGILENSTKTKTEEKDGETVQVLVRSRGSIQQIFSYLDKTITALTEEDDKGNIKISSKARNFILKPILMVTNYGASVATVINNFIHDVELQFTRKALELKLKSENEKLSKEERDLALTELEELSLTLTSFTISNNHFSIEELKEIRNYVDANKSKEIDDLVADLSNYYQDKLNEISITDGLNANQISDLIWKNLKGAINKFKKDKDIDFVSMSVDDIKAFEIKNGRYDYSKSNFERTLRDTYGAAIRTTLDNQFGAFSDARNIFNSGLQMVYSKFKAKYDKWKKEQIEQTGREPTKDEKAQYMLDHIQEAPVLMTPQAQVYLDKHPGDLKGALKYGVAAIKFKKTRQYSNEFQEQVSGKDLATINSKGEYTTTQSSSGYASVTDIADPGIGGFVLSIHTIDSANIQYNLVEIIEDSFLVHDANVMGINNAINNTKNYNEGHWKLNTEYGLFKAFVDTFNRNISTSDLRESAYNKELINTFKRIIESKKIKFKDTAVSEDEVDLNAALNVMKEIINDINLEINTNREQIKRRIINVVHAAFFDSAYKTGNAQLLEEKNIEELVEGVLKIEFNGGPIQKGSIVRYKNKDYTVESITNDGKSAKLVGEHGRAVRISRLKHLEYQNIAPDMPNPYEIEWEDLESDIGMGNIKKSREAGIPEENYEYQTESNLPLASTNPKLFDDLREHFTTLYPEITLQIFDKVTDQFGKEVLGKAITDVIYVSASKGALDTIPHEYAHVYLNLLERTVFVKSAINYFKNTLGFKSNEEAKEALASKMGEYVVKLASGISINEMAESITAKEVNIIKALWYKILDFFTNKITKRINSEIYALKLADRLYAGINNDAIRYTNKPGTARVDPYKDFILQDFPREVMNSLMQKGKGQIAFTGSEALAMQSNIYRKQSELGTDLHDLDFAVRSEEDVFKLKKHLEDNFSVYTSGNFKAPDPTDENVINRVVNLLVLPKGHTVANIKRVWNTFGRVTSYDIVNFEGDIVGNYSAKVEKAKKGFKTKLLDENTEGMAAVVVDLLENRTDFPTFTWKSPDGVDYTIVDYKEIFDAKDRIGFSIPRSKDVLDYNSFFNTAFKEKLTPEVKKIISKSESKFYNALIEADKLTGVCK